MSIMIWGHRGHRHFRYPQTYPHAPFENTLPAYGETLQHCAGIECDLIQSRDATIYLAHGTSFDETGRAHELRDTLDKNSQVILGERFIYQLSDEVVHHLKLVDHEQMPTLWQLMEVMKHYPQRFLNLELKGPLDVQAMLKLVDAAIARDWISWDRIIISSFYFSFLQDLRELRGDAIKLGCLFDAGYLPHQRMYPNWPDAPQDAYYIPFHLEEKPFERDDVKAIKPDFFHLEYNSLSNDVVNEMNRFFPEARLIVWTDVERHPHQDQSLLQKIKEIEQAEKIYAVISDFPQVLQKQFQAKGITVQAL